MRRLCLLVCVGLAIFGVPASAQAQDSIKVGVLTELSGPLGTLGMAERDGFLLYLKKANGKLDGLTVKTVVEDTCPRCKTRMQPRVLRSGQENDNVCYECGRRGEQIVVAVPGAWSC
jgi:hypothetical protein